MLVVMHRRRLLLSCAAAACATLPFGAQALEQRPLRFPRDFGAHAEQGIEWWYVTGFLNAAPSAAAAGALAEPLFGFQITFFRSRTGVDASHPSRFAARQLLFGHAALTDLRARRLLHDQRIARQGFGLAEFDSADTHVVLKGWSLQRQPFEGGSRYTAKANCDYAGFGLNLQFDTSQPVLLQGDAGWSRKGPQSEQASLYYSQPQLVASGEITLGQQIEKVTGRAWLDHEWSDSLLHPDAVGWDWIGMNMADGSALTAFRLRRADGSAFYAGGGLRRPGGAMRSYGADEVRFTPLRAWSSGRSAARYPVRWAIETPDGRFEVAALLDDQELDSRASTGAVYWEGLSELLDAGGRRVGLGYLEMTGYASALRL